MRRLLFLSALAVPVMVACAPVPPAEPVEPEIRPIAGPGECPIEAYRRYVGRNRSELPARPQGEVWRVVCSTCAVTMDYHPARLNILYDTATGRITEVKCG